VSGEGRPYNPQACVVEGERIGIFIGSGYRYLTLEQAQQLRDRIEASVLALSAESSLPAPARFLRHFATLIDMFDVSISIDLEDNRVFIKADGKEIFSRLPGDGCAVVALRAAADALRASRGDQ
jgi:hypothetical protein